MSYTLRLPYDEDLYNMEMALSCAKHLGYIPTCENVEEKGVRYNELTFNNEADASMFILSCQPKKIKLQTQYQFSSVTYSTAFIGSSAGFAKFP